MMDLKMLGTWITLLLAFHGTSGNHHLGSFVDPYNPERDNFYVSSISEKSYKNVNSGLSAGRHIGRPSSSKTIFSTGTSYNPPSSPDLYVPPQAPLYPSATAPEQYVPSAIKNVYVPPKTQQKNSPPAVKTHSSSLYIPPTAQKLYASSLTAEIRPAPVRNVYVPPPTQNLYAFPLTAKTRPAPVRNVYVPPPIQNIYAPPLKVKTRPAPVRNVYVPPPTQNIYATPLKAKTHPVPVKNVYVPPPIQNIYAPPPAAALYIPPSAPRSDEYAPVRSSRTELTSSEGFSNVWVPASVPRPASSSEYRPSVYRRPAAAYPLPFSGNDIIANSDVGKGPGRVYK